MGTRRRPIGRDYAAAKDAEWGMRNSDLSGGSSAFNQPGVDP
jgi:hypothetical protein